MKQFFVFLFLVLLIIAGSIIYFARSQEPLKPLAPSPSEMQSMIAATPTVDPAYRMGIYTGTLPCADCTGLEMQLTLYRNKLSSTEGVYTLQQTYIGKGNPQTTFGNWKISRGTPTNPQAEVYILYPENEQGATTYFLKVNETQIKLLDNEQREIDSSFNYLLIKG